jgi:hypothetical protein
LAAHLEMGLEDLAYIHSGRNTEWVDHDVDGGAIRKIRHVLFRHNPGDDPFVPMPTGDLVSDGEFPLHGDVYFH